VTGAGCVASASLYSGRPDPEWPVDDARVRALKRLWRTLAPSATAPRQAPPLGYRGCALQCPAGHEWFAYNGVATYRHGNETPEHRLDAGRQFERALLDTAPPGRLPPGVTPP